MSWLSRNFVAACAATLCLICTPLLAQADNAASYPQVRSLFPTADRIDNATGTPPASEIFKNGERIGYAFLTEDIVRIPAYSGRPVNVLVGIDLQGRIVGARIVHHEEPILAAGISEEKLHQYTDQYRGKSTSGKIVIGGHRDGFATIDGLSGATITSMVINTTITRAVKVVGESRGIVPAAVETSVPAQKPAVATAKEEPKAKPAAQPASQPAKPKQTLPKTQTAKATEPKVDITPAPSPVSPPLVTTPAAPQAITEFPIFATDTIYGEPMWLSIWMQRKLEISLLLAGLGFLSCILLFHDYLARNPRLLGRIRIGFLLYTLIFIGWYALGQLSIINVLTFAQSLMRHFSWDTFLIDPMLFLLWSFVAVALLLWGRGVYCGWLCPFGALQELTYQLARKLHLPFFEMPNVVHERLLALKFIIMLALFGLSLQSMLWAIKFAEVEPFKTAINLHFQREWGYVAFALGILTLTALNRKFYCKYLCPLGAALIIPGRFHSFEWLRRRKECGRPCQVCAVECEVQAIKPTGEIVVNECHYCLDCQITFYNNHKCPPLVEKRKRREQRLGTAAPAENNQQPIQIHKKPD